MKKLLMFLCLNALGYALSAQQAGGYQPNLAGPGYSFAFPAGKVSDAYDPFKIKIPPPDNDYLRKSKNQKKAAFILLGAGAGLIIASVIIPRGELVKEGVWLDPAGDKYENDGVRTALFLTGAASALASIPLFIGANKNRKKQNSTSLIIKLENRLVARQNSISSNNYPAAGLQFSLHY